MSHKYGLTPSEFVVKWRLAGRGQGIGPVERIGGFESVMPFYRISGPQIELLVSGIEQLLREKYELREELEKINGETREATVTK